MGHLETFPVHFMEITRRAADQEDSLCRVSAVIAINKLDVIFIAALKSLLARCAVRRPLSVQFGSVGPEPHSFGNTNIMLYDQNYQHIPQTVLSALGS